MTKSVAYISLICMAAIIMVAATCRPDSISDDNAFLKGFVNHEFLNLLGVIIAITLASAGQIHLTLN